MAVTWVWCGMVLLSLLFGLVNGRLDDVAAAALEVITVSSQPMRPASSASSTSSSVMILVTEAGASRS